MLPKTSATIVITSSTIIVPLTVGVTTLRNRDKRMEIAIWNRPETIINAAIVAGVPCCSAMMQKGMAMEDG